MRAACNKVSDISVTDNSADELAARLVISPAAIEEAIRRGLLSFVMHRKVACWRFGDSHNASFRRMDGAAFHIGRQSVKAEGEMSGNAWHRFIGLDDVVENDRREILITPEGAKDALAALHFADAEATLSHIGVVAALGAGVKLLADDVEKFRGRRVRIFGDADAIGKDTTSRIAQQLAPVADEVQIFDLAGLHCEEGSLVKDLFDLSRIDYDDFEANRDLWLITDLDSKGARVKTIPTRFCSSGSSKIIPIKQEFLLSPSPLPHVSPESHGFPVYPVSNSQELEKELEELAERNACIARHTARARRWKLERDLLAVQKRISRKLNLDELMKSFDKWHSASQPYLDPQKTRDDYLAAFLGELGKVRVPTGGGKG